MTLAQAKQMKTRKELVAEMVDQTLKFFAKLSPEEAEARLSAAEKAAAAAKSSRSRARQRVMA